MTKLAGVNHRDADRALEKAVFWIERQGKHIVMTDGDRTITIPRNNPINAITISNIVRDAGPSNAGVQPPVAAGSAATRG